MAWKLRVIARMEELGISRAEMSRRLRQLTGSGTAQSLTNLLGPEGEQPVASSTKQMPAIHRILGWPPPAEDEAPEKPNEDLASRLRAVAGDLDTTDRAVIEAIVAKHTKKP